MSKNTVYRIYKQECLGLKKAPRKFSKRLSKARVAPTQASRPNQRWSIDFIYHHLSNGTRFRSLSVIDQYSRMCLVFIPRIRFLGQDVIESLETVAQQLGQYPESITSDNGPEFTSLVYDEWAKKLSIQVDLITPGKSNQNGFVESFHGRIRDECLSINRYQTLKAAEVEIGIWIKDYNNVRPHSSLKDEVPNKI